MKKRIIALLIALGWAGLVAAEPMPLPAPALKMSLGPLFDVAVARATTLGSGGGGFTANVTKPSGCTASTLLWIDSGGLVQCGATATASAMTQLTLGTGASTSKLELTGTAGTVNGTTRLALSAGGSNPSYLGLVGNFISTYGIDFDPASSVVGITKLATGVLKTTAAAGTGDGWYQNNAGEASLAGNYTNATASLTATNLSLTVISGRHYNFDAYLQLTESTAADGVAIAFDGGSAAATDFIVTCVLTNITGTTVTQANAIATALATVINATTTVVTTQQMYECHGMFTPAGAGTFALRAHQDTHSTGTLTLLKGSSLTLRDTKVL